jgi:hypothetical protein
VLVLAALTVCDCSSLMMELRLGHLGPRSGNPETSPRHPWSGRGQRLSHPSPVRRAMRGGGERGRGEENLGREREVTSWANCRVWPLSAPSAAFECPSHARLSLYCLVPMPPCSRLRSSQARWKTFLVHRRYSNSPRTACLEALAPIFLRHSCQPLVP